MRVTLIHNPAAGEGRPAKGELLRLIRKAGHDAVYRSSKEVGVKAALKSAKGLVAVAGGDGTVRRITLRMNGNRCPLAALPLGTANNIAKTLGQTGPLPRLIGGWSEGLPRRFDIGAIKSPWGKARFVEGAGIGWMAEILALLKRRPHLEPHVSASRRKSLAHSFANFRESLPALSPIAAEVVIDGRMVEGRFLLIEVMNIKSVGPNLMLAPQADPGDGLLDVVLVKERERKKLIRYLEARLEGRDESPTFAVTRARRVRIRCKTHGMHVDDKLLPHGSGRMPHTARARFATIDFGLDPQPASFLLPKPAG